MRSSIKTQKVKAMPYQTQPLTGVAAELDDKGQLGRNEKPKQNWKTVSCRIRLCALLEAK